MIITVIDLMDAYRKITIYNKQTYYKQYKSKIN
jgi:hypothetical protein